MYEGPASAQALMFAPPGTGRRNRGLRTGGDAADDLFCVAYGERPTRCKWKLQQLREQ